MLENFEMFKVPLSLGDKNVSKKVFVKRRGFVGVGDRRKSERKKSSKKKNFSVIKEFMRLNPPLF